MHVKNRRVTTRLGNIISAGKLYRIDTTRLLERKGSRNGKQRQRNKSYLLGATPFRANLQEEAISGFLVMFRKQNSSLLYWEMERDGIPDRKNKTCIIPSEKILTINHCSPHPKRLNSTIYSLSRLCRSRDYTLKDGIITNYSNNYVTVDLNNMGIHFHKVFNYKWSKAKLYIHPPIPVQNRVLHKIKQDKAQGIIIEPIWPGQSWLTKLKILSTKFLFLGQADKILQMGQRMKDMDQKLLPGNVGAFLLDLSQMQRETNQLNA
ncbi:MAG: hypothetical protein EZS28_001553 [Streblomastix strix]|uniref:Uncharacterized protein n=1 Tax=Streblomastix strix TaxID=222440 RepID=A0A5J4X7S9_9EUKA|nr:MAG: hypothetical protein EZS28_001553 [Streblomastix strix]